MRNPDLLRCSECGESFPTDGKHNHVVNTLSIDPPSYVLIAPPSQDAPIGSWQLAKIFAGAIADIQKRHPSINFSVVPYTFQTLPQQQQQPSMCGIESLLVFASALHSVPTTSP